MPREKATFVTTRGSAAIAGLAIILFLLLATSVSMGVTLQFDQELRSRVHSTASGPLTAIAIGASYLGSLKVIIPLSLVIIAGLLLVQRRHGAAALGAAMAGAILLNWGFKHAFHRIRPQPFIGIDPESFSFPSGHAFFALCFYGAVLLILRDEIRGVSVWSALAAILIIAIGWSRIYLGVHYPTDVVGGYFVGVFWLGTLSCIRVFSRDFRSRHAELQG